MNEPLNKVKLKKEPWYPSSNFWTALATVVIAVATIVYVQYAGKQWRVMKNQLEVMDNQLKAMQDTLALEHPAKLIINNISIWDTSKPHPGEEEYNFSKRLVLVPGQKLEGTIYAVNVGDTTAIIDNSIYMAWWEGSLPMVRPYAGRHSNNSERLVDNKENPVTELPSGGYGQFNVKTTVPKNYDGTKPLYIIGYVIHRSVLKDGSLKMWHNVLFARRYDPSKGYFIPVKDRPDYEGYE